MRYARRVKKKLNYTAVGEGAGGQQLNQETTVISHVAE